MQLSSEKVRYHVQSLLLFLRICKDNRTLSETFVEEAIAKCIEIQGMAAANPEQAASEINLLIEKMNHSLTAPYPMLSYDSLDNLVKGEIAAFEHFLNQELKANHLSIQDESALFNDSLSLWEKIGLSLTAGEGVKEFVTLIERVNRLMPDERHYPRPNEKDYLS